MRAITILAVLACGILTACSGDPRSLGITGPGVQAVPAPEADTGNSAAAGVQPAGMSYGTTYGPVTGQSGFWGYNR